MRGVERESPEERSRRRSHLTSLPRRSSRPCRPGAERGVRRYSPSHGRARRHAPPTGRVVAASSGSRLGNIGYSFYLILFGLLKEMYRFLLFFYNLLRLLIIECMGSCEKMRVFISNYANWPQSVIFTSFFVEPSWEPNDSIRRTISIPLLTRPKTQCFPSSQGVASHVIKN